MKIYTVFGYDGVGTARRIKDEVVEELQRLGKTWTQVTEAVRSQALKPQEQPKKPIALQEGLDLAGLIDEAKRIDIMLDALSLQLAS